MLEEEDRKEIIKLSEATHTSVIAFVLSLFIPFVGLILGLKAKSEIDKSEHTKSGSAFATAAIWIGAIGTLAWAALIALALVFSVGGHDHGQGWGFGNRFDNRGFANHQMMRRPFQGQTQAVPGDPVSGDPVPGNGMMGRFGQGQGDQSDQGGATPASPGTTSNG